MSIVWLSGQDFRGGGEMDQALVLLQGHCGDVSDGDLQEESPGLWEHLEHLWTVRGGGTMSFAELRASEQDWTAAEACSLWLTFISKSFPASAVWIPGLSHKPLPGFAPQRDLHNALTQAQPERSGLTCGIRAPSVEVVRGGRSGNWQREGGKASHERGGGRGGHSCPLGVPTERN